MTDDQKGGCAAGCLLLIGLGVGLLIELAPLIVLIFAAIGVYHVFKG